MLTFHTMLFFHQPELLNC